MNKPLTQTEQTALEVSRWRDRVQTIQAGITAAQAVVDNGDQRRGKHALNAALADGDALKELARIRGELEDAQRSLGDLKLALPQAESRLADAERDHRGAEAELRKIETRRLVLERLQDAIEIDKALSVVAKHTASFAKTGRDLLALQEPSSISHAEGILGLTRFAAALPPVFLELRKNFPMADLSTGVSLTESERAFWGLPPVQEVQADDNTDRARRAG